MVHSQPCAAKEGCLVEIWQVTVQARVVHGLGAEPWDVWNSDGAEGVVCACPGCGTPWSDGE